MKKMLELINVTKKFDTNIAVDNISFNVQPGKIFGLVENVELNRLDDFLNLR